MTDNSDILIFLSLNFRDGRDIRSRVVLYSSGLLRDEEPNLGASINKKILIIRTLLTDQHESRLILQFF